MQAQLRGIEDRLEREAAKLELHSKELQCYVSGLKSQSIRNICIAIMS